MRSGIHKTIEHVVAESLVRRGLLVGEAELLHDPPRRTVMRERERDQIAATRADRRRRRPRRVRARSRSPRPSARAWSSSRPRAPAGRRTRSARARRARPAPRSSARTTSSSRSRAPPSARRRRPRAARPLAVHTPPIVAPTRGSAKIGAIRSRWRGPRRSPRSRGVPRSRRMSDHCQGRLRCSAPWCGVHRIASRDAQRDPASDGQARPALAQAGGEDGADVRAGRRAGRGARGRGGARRARSTRRS